MSIEIAFTHCNCPRRHRTQKAWLKCAFKGEGTHVTSVQGSGPYAFLHLSSCVCCDEGVSITLFEEIEPALAEIKKHNQFVHCSGSCSGHHLGVFDYPF